jgi:hypothetical protein
MKRLILLVMLLTMVNISVVTVHGADKPRIDLPHPGDALQGIVEVRGSTKVANFQSAELSFQYMEAESDTWYLIQQNREAVEDGLLGTWDTTTIADGTYRLRILVVLDTGKTVEAVVNEMRVRNYSPIETETPDASSEQLTETLTPQTFPSPTLPPTPTSLNANPAQVTPDQLGQYLLWGGLTTMILFLLVSIYRWARSLRRRI